MPDNPRRSLPTFSLRALLGLVLLGAVLSLGAFFMLKLRDTARDYQYVNNFKQIGLALLTYESTFRDFPRSSAAPKPGQPGCSWRTLILPFYESMGPGPRYDYSQAWDSAANAHFGQLAHMAYVWEPAPRAGHELDTNALGIQGPGAIFDDERATPIEISPATADLIIAIEVRDSGIHWLEPRDLDYRELIERERKGDLKLGAVESSIGVLFLDGRAWRLRADTPRDLLLTFMTIEGAQRHDAEQVLGAHRCL